MPTITECPPLPETVTVDCLKVRGAAAALGTRFRVYSITTMVVLVAAGVLTSLDAPRIQADLPTPWVGVWERINIGVFLAWVVALAITLLRARETLSAAGRHTSTEVAIHGFARPGFEEQDG